MVAQSRRESNLSKTSFWEILRRTTCLSSRCNISHRHSYYDGQTKGKNVIKSMENVFVILCMYINSKNSVITFFVHSIHEYNMLYIITAITILLRASTSRRTRVCHSRNMNHLHAFYS